MNKKSFLVGLILVILAIVIMAFISMSGSRPVCQEGDIDCLNNNDDEMETQIPVVSETKQISSSISEYQNAELGFSLKYPSDWKKEEANAGVTFIIPVDETQVSTVATLQAAVQVLPGTCAFPPVTTIKDRETVKVGDKSFNMISMDNTVQGRVYFNRMYSLQSGSICYMFSFASISANPTTKGLTGSNVTQAQNNNKAITASADKNFTDMVKSFGFVKGAEGVDETKVK